MKPKKSRPTNKNRLRVISLIAVFTIFLVIFTQENWVNTVLQKSFSSKRENPAPQESLKKQPGIASRKSYESDVVTFIWSEKDSKDKTYMQGFYNYEKVSIESGNADKYNYLPVQVIDAGQIAYISEVLRPESSFSLNLYDLAKQEMTVLSENETEIPKLYDVSFETTETFWVYQSNSDNSGLELHYFEGGVEKGETSIRGNMVSLDPTSRAVTVSPEGKFIALLTGSQKGGANLNLFTIEDREKLALKEVNVVKSIRDYAWISADELVYNEYSSETFYKMNASSGELQKLAITAAVDSFYYNPGENLLIYTRGREEGEVSVYSYNLDENKELEYTSDYDFVRWVGARVFLGGKSEVCKECDLNDLSKLSISFIPPVKEIINIDVQNVVKSPITYYQ